jgi:hypothetical protein
MTKLAYFVLSLNQSVTCFEYCVARRIWEVIVEITDLPLITDFESMAKWWIRGKKCNSINVLYTVVLWSLWKLRNSLCFQGQCWARVRRLLVSCARMVRNWALLNSSKDAARVEIWAKELEVRGTRSERLAWRPPDDGAGALNDQASRHGNLVGSEMSRLDENLSNDTDGSLHVETDAADGNCNVVHSNNDLSFE